jgi:hypothetical protein
MKKYLLFLVVIFTLYPAHSAFASVRINEVMYDIKDGPDADHEWVELYNDGEEPVSINGWKFNDGSNHVLNDPPGGGGQGALSIGAHEYLILSGDAAVFLQDYPGFAGSVIDTVMSLNNASETLSITNSSGEVVDTISYTSDLGGSSDGNSLNREGESLSPKSPTPGAENAEESAEVPEDMIETQAGGGAAPEEVFTTYPIVVEIIATKGFAGVPVVISPFATGHQKQELSRGKFVWSMGDGNTRIETSNREFEYTYKFPGEYVIFLEYYEYEHAMLPSATVRKTIKISQPGVMISAIHPDGSIEISNSGGQEVNLSRWSLKTDTGETYTFTQKVFVLANTKIRLQKEILGFQSIPKKIELLDPSLGVVAGFPGNIQKLAAAKKTVSTASKSKPKAVPIKIEVPPEASVHKSGFVIPKKSLPFALGGLVLLATSLCFIYMKPKEKEKIKSNAYEYEIEETI